MIRFLLMVNKQGQTRLAQYFEFKPLAERIAIENDLIRRCLSRSEDQCNFIEYKQDKIVYRRYASLYFILGIEPGTNELSILELIHAIVETLDGCFENVCELDIMFNLEKAHFIVNEMICDGCIINTNKSSILAPIMLMEKAV